MEKIMYLEPYDILRFQGFVDNWGVLRLRPVAGPDTNTIYLIDTETNGVIAEVSLSDVLDRVNVHSALEDQVREYSQCKGMMVGKLPMPIWC
jgi:hypothetical protein